MKRLLFLSLVLAALMARSACTGREHSVGVVVEGGADAAGAAVSLDGRLAGSMQPHGAGASRLVTRGVRGRWSRVTVVSASGRRLAILASLEESTLVRVSFADRRIEWMPALAPVIAYEADTTGEDDD